MRGQFARSMFCGSIGVEVGEPNLTVASARNDHAVVREGNEFGLKDIGAMSAFVFGDDSGG